MKAIVAIDRAGGIGRDGKLLFHISDDLKRFKEMTIGNTIIIGRKTLESLPGKKPLPERINVVLTKQRGYEPEGNCIVVHSINEILNDIVPNTKDQEIFVVGGGEVYKQLLPYCDTVYMTLVDRVYGSDAFFPVLDPKTWTIAEEDVSDTFIDDKTHVPYTFFTYHKK